MKRLLLLVIPIVALVGLPPPTAIAAQTGQFVLRCKYSHTLMDDPIVFPGRPGASHMHDFFGNVNLTFVDDVDIRIGDGVMIAPSVTLTTTGHPVHPSRRTDFGRFSEPIVIEDKVWIGSNAVVLPGVRIGYGSVIGAGSVVSRSIPPMTVALGTPCRVVRAITDEDLATRTAKG